MSEAGNRTMFQFWGASSASHTDLARNKRMHIWPTARPSLKILARKMEIVAMEGKNRAVLSQANYHRNKSAVFTFDWLCTLVNSGALSLGLAIVGIEITPVSAGMECVGQ